MTTLSDQLQGNMIFRSHEADGCVSRVWYSRCEVYRYGLSRVWGDTDRAVLFLMLNPSTADEHRNDPTVARCETRARQMGYGGMMIANIFAFRATKPASLKKAAQPVGDLNDAVLAEWSETAEMIVAAWGAHGAHQERARDVSVLLPDKTFHLGLTKHGHPRHPLYVSFDTQPQVWAREDRYSV